MAVNTTTLAGIMAASWGNFYDVDRPATSPTPAQLEIPWISAVPTSPTDVTIIIMTPSVTPGSYRGDLTKGSSFSGPDRTFNDGDGVFTFTGLTPGATYRLRAACHASNPAIYGAYKYESFTMPKAATVGGTATTTSGTTVPNNSSAPTGSGSTDSGVNNNTEEATDGSSPVVVPTGTSNAVVGNRQVTRSLFKVTNNSKNKDVYSLVTKDFGISTSSTHYAFGTGMFFQSSVTNTDAEGGFGFFVNSTGTSGYYVIMQTTTNLTTLGEKEVKIIKVVNGKKTVLSDSQENASSSVNGIVGAKNYKVDVKVKTTATTNVIDVYINNFKISAVDSNAANTTDPQKLIIQPTAKMAMVSSVGSSFFDYIYATPIDENQYNTGVMQNVYNGQFAATTLNFLYGEKVLSNFDKIDLPNGKIEEFGTVARELRKLSLKFTERPGYPLYATTGINKYVQVLGSRLTSFGAEIYLINNAGTYVPLDDGQTYSFSVIGNYVVPTGQHEYVDSSVNEFSAPEPAIFESMWIQNEADAKKLSEWIKAQWSKQQMVVNMEIFGNPLISVGDVITINYPDNNLDGTGKFVVTNVNLSYDGGIGTNITARSIYS
jgi:hypothetical protein